MEDVIVLIELVVAGAFLIGITVVALIARGRGEPRGKTLKTWFVRFVETITSLG
jgi:hypothetical protein